MSEPDKLTAYRQTADAKRRSQQFQVRLPRELAEKLRLYMTNHNLNENQVLKHIINYYFSKTPCSTSPQSETLEETQNLNQ